MARNYVEEWSVYVPKDEREAFKENPDDALYMEVKAMARSELKGYLKLQRQIESGGISTEKALEEAENLIGAHVRNVCGLLKGRNATGKEFFDYAPSDEMLSEVTQAITNRSTLNEGLAKKLKSGFVTPSAQPQVNENGGAQDVTPQSRPMTLETSEQKTQSYDYEIRTNDANVTASPKVIRDSM